jgi:hypothetical protein
MGRMLRNATCPGPNDADDAARRIRNITSLCAVADPVDGSLVGGVRLQGGQGGPGGGADDGGPLCVIYSVTATPADGGGDGDGAAAVGAGGMERGGAGGLYGPGLYQFDFSDFRTAEFRYAFWSIQFLRLGGEEGSDGGGDGSVDGVLRANVTAGGSFVNNPPALPKPLLVNAFFVAALVVCAVFFVSCCAGWGGWLIDAFRGRRCRQEPHPLLDDTSAFIYPL